MALTPFHVRVDFAVERDWIGAETLFTTLAATTRTASSYNSAGLCSFHFVLAVIVVRIYLL